MLHKMYIFSFSTFYLAVIVPLLKLMMDRFTQPTLMQLAFKSVALVQTHNPLLDIFINIHFCAKSLHFLFKGPKPVQQRGTRLLPIEL